MRFGRRFKPRRGNRRLRIKRAKRLRTFRNEKRKLGLAGQIIYAGLPERKKMFLTSGIQSKTLLPKDGQQWLSIPLTPKETKEWGTLFHSGAANWDKIAVSRIYIKLIPEYNSYTTNGKTIVPQLIGYYVIGATTTNSTGYSDVKQLMNFDASRPFTILLEKPSCVVQYGAAVHRAGTYLSVIRMGEKKPTTNDDNNKPTNDDDNKPKQGCYRYNQPPVDDDDDDDYMSEDDEVWGDEQNATIDNHYGNLVIGLDDLTSVAETGINIRYKVFYKVHLRG